MNQSSRLGKASAALLGSRRAERESRRALIVAAGNAITIRAGNLILHADLSMTPKALPQETEMAPIKLRASGSAETSDGNHIPPAKTAAPASGPARAGRICRTAELSAAAPSKLPRPPRP